MGQFPAFVLVSCLRIMDMADVDQARAARRFDVTFRARLLQVSFKATDTRMLRNSHVHSWAIQQCPEELVIRSLSMKK